MFRSVLRTLPEKDRLDFNRSLEQIVNEIGLRFEVPLIGALTLRDGYYSPVISSKPLSILLRLSGLTPIEIADKLQSDESNQPVTAHVAGAKAAPLNPAGRRPSDHLVMDNLVSQRISKSEWDNVEKIRLTIELGETDRMLPQDLAAELTKYDIQGGILWDQPNDIDALWVVPTATGTIKDITSCIGAIAAETCPEFQLEQATYGLPKDFISKT